MHFIQTFAKQFQNIPKIQFSKKITLYKVVCLSPLKFKYEIQVLA